MVTVLFILYQWAAMPVMLCVSPIYISASLSEGSNTRIQLSYYSLAHLSMFPPTMVELSQQRLPPYNDYHFITDALQHIGPKYNCV